MLLPHPLLCVLCVRAASIQFGLRLDVTRMPGRWWAAGVGLGYSAERTNVGASGTEGEARQRGRGQGVDWSKRVRGPNWSGDAVRAAAAAAAAETERDRETERQKGWSVRGRQGKAGESQVKCYSDGQ